MATLSKLAKNKALVAFIIATILFIGILFLNNFSVINIFNLKLTDHLYSQQNLKPSNDIVIISIDSKSTQSPPLGFGPIASWTKKNYTDLAKTLSKADPKVVAFDLLFSVKPEINETFEDYLNLSNALKELNNYALAFATTGPNGKPLYPIDILSRNGYLGFVDAKLDDDGVLRKIKPFFYDNDKKQSFGSLGAISAILFQDLEDIKAPESFNFPTDKDGYYLINYFGPAQSYKNISFIDVVTGKIPLIEFKDKVVLVGVSTTRTGQDRYLVPTAKNSGMAGVEIRANEIQTVLDNKFLKEQSLMSFYPMLAILSVGFTLAFVYLSVLPATVVLFVGLIGYYFGARIAFNFGLILNLLSPILLILSAYIAAFVYRYFVADKAGRELKLAFSHYLSPQMVEQISKNPDLVKLGGENKVLTVFFSDLKNSTTLSEKAEIKGWVSQINEYFTVMENIIKRYGGTLDKYEGDGIMGFFNAPISEEDHICRSYFCALEMQKALKLLNEKWQKEGRVALEFRLGINTGEAIVGNFGSKERFDYTAMGDTVNTASRLESSANKTYGTNVMVAGFERYAGPKDLSVMSNLVLREIDTVILPGKKEPITLFELIGTKQEISPEKISAITDYLNALAFYKKRDFLNALAFFKKASLTGDAPALVMQKRCEKIVAGKPPKALDINSPNGKPIFKIASK